MAKRAMVGLDIGTSGVRAAELTTGRSGGRLERFGQVALPPGAVRDGEVVDIEAVAAALRSLWAQTKLSSKNVVVGVANQKVVVRQVDLPWLPPDELKASLPFQVQDYIPMRVEDAILDCHPLEEHPSDTGGRMLRVLLVAAARTMVDAALTAVTSAGLQPMMVDLNGFAVLRAQAHADSGIAAVHANALVDIGASVTNIVVHQGGVPRFVRILLMGGADITEGLAERLGIPLDQAESIKQETGLAVTPSLAEAHPASREIEAAGGALIDEVRGSLEYYQAQGGGLRIGRIVLSGGGALLGGLTDRLAAATRLPVEIGQPLSTLSIGATGLSEEQIAALGPVATTPVGLAMGLAA